jgi:hypothetical protein
MSANAAVGMHSPPPQRPRARGHEDGLRRPAARRRRGAREKRRLRQIPATGAVTLRFAFPDDDRTLATLAALDSSARPPEPVLLAEVGGELRAAMSLADDTVVADPFHHTLWLIELLAALAAQLTTAAGARGRIRGLGRTRFRPASPLR